MLHRCLKMPRVVNVPSFWIWHGCISKGNAEFWICRNKAQHASVMPQYVKMSQYAFIFLNMVEYCWIFLNMPANAWINCSDRAKVFKCLKYILNSWQGFEYISSIKCAWVLNMLQHSHNNIIIVTNAIILEFWSSRLVHPGAHNVTY